MELSNGGWCAYGLSLRPCLWTETSFIVHLTIGKPPLHVPHFLLTSSHNDQVRECRAAGNKRLFDMIIIMTIITISN